MSEQSPPFSDDVYLAALRLYLLSRSEAALQEAHAIGHAAIRQGVAPLDLVLLHNRLLLKVLADLGQGVELVMAAAEFLAECLGPREMIVRGFHEANLSLAATAADLQRSNAALAVAHRQLERETAERRQEQAALHHAQRLQTLGQLAGGIAHHFNNLLTVVLGSLELARVRQDGSLDLKKLIDNAHRSATRAAEVAAQLLSFARHQRLEPKIIDPGQKLADLMSLLKNSLREDISVETDFPEGLWKIEIDPAQLELALLNLGLNARDAMPKGGVLHVSAANRHVAHVQGLSGDYLVIEVRDDGSGVAPEHMPYIFDPFFTTKEVGAGTGLGLSQVHSFARHSGGAIEVENTPGHGATFRLYLPAVIDDRKSE